MESYVRLTLPVDADSPHEAVLKFIQRIVDDGLSAWIYRVEQDGQYVFLDGNGVVYDLAAVAERATVHGGGSQEENLLDLARQLADQTRMDDRL